MSASAQLSRKQQLEEILAVRGKATPTTKQKEETKAKDSRFANIESNPFFQAIFDEALSPEAKQAAVTKLLTFVGTREENRERVKAFDLFKEYLQAEREVMATQIIKMSDTRNFATLKTVFEDINNALIEFEGDMKPLTDIIDALHQLRADNQTLDAFREIKNEEDRRKAIDQRDAELNEQIKLVQARVDELKTQNRVEEQNKGFFGFGSIKTESVEKIARNKVAIENSLDELNRIRDEAQKNKEQANTNSESKITNLEAKEKLKEMLNLATDEHQQRSQRLIDSAVNFVQTSKGKIETIREHLSHMGDQIQNLDDANGQMSFIYAILGEGVKGAEAENKKIREEVITPRENENMVEKLTRENKQRDLNEHIQMLEVSAADTTATVADLTSASIRIKNMNDANQSQIQMARDMHARGVAGVADRLSTVIQAVGAAAIAESNAMTAETLKAMSDNTDVIAQKESMRIALGIQDRNNDIVRAIESLAQYGEVNKVATEFTRQGIETMRENLELMQATAREVADSVLESKSVVADIVMGSEPKAKEEAAKKTVKSPFALNA
jgi:hypothetical protein